MLPVVDLKTIKLLRDQNCNPTKWVSHSTHVKVNLHFPNIPSFGHVSCLTPSFFMLHLCAWRSLGRFMFPGSFVSEQKRLHTSSFTAEAYLLEERSDRAKIGYLSPVSLNSALNCHAFIKAYRNCKIFVVSFLMLQASSFMCYKRQ